MEELESLRTDDREKYGEESDISKDSSFNEVKNGWRQVTGIVLTSLAVLGYVTAPACIQVIEKVPPPFELTAFRFAIVTMICLVYFILSKRFPVVHGRREVIIVLVISMLNLIGCVVYNTKYLKALPVGTVGSIFQGELIIFGTLLALIFLNEKLNPKKSFAIALCLIGLSLSFVPYFVKDQSQPGSNITGSDVTESDKAELNITGIYNKDCTTGNNSVINGGVDSDKVTCDLITGNNIKVNMNTRNDVTGSRTVILDVLTEIFLLTADTVSMTILSTLIKVSSTETPVIIQTFWMYLIGAVISLIVTFTVEEPFIPDTNNDFYFTSTVILTSALGTLFLLLAMPRISQILLYLLMSSQIPLLLLLQCFILPTIIVTNWLQILGAILVFIASISLPLGDLIQHMFGKPVV